ncbi:hypothetical protein DAPPUDRAFT_312491 [Daphnia pulex]|uniref:Uncharacterized protein n=1 Tax=Daphnia pulex TaxID=6669 RepID=E9FZ73_DAPPU|nr:hypothetical protein DAPPUDRAFT_312491 [Daphnia pulex]|eukprot:EFX87002.1 hypothetical protein DAPPUDRAFT_312491 [Daphnia pulex]
MDAIREDFKKTGKCRLQLARDGFSNALVSFALPKNSKFTNTISKGMLELMQSGIIDHWDLWFRPMPLQCMGNIRNAHTTETSTTLKQKNHPPSLSLKNLTGAFVWVQHFISGFPWRADRSSRCPVVTADAWRKLGEARSTKKCSLKINKEVGTVSKEIHYILDSKMIGSNSL